MDPATIIGILGAFGSLFGLVFIEHVSIAGLVLPGPIILVFGASIAVGFAGSTIKDSLSAFKAIPAAFKGKRPDFEATIGSLTELADTARRNGLLSLEDAASGLDDEFLKAALQGVADGADSEDLRTQLEDEIATSTTADKNAGKFFGALGGYAPTVGIIGTVVSLTHVLANLSTPNKLGPLIASAFVATLWGLLSANFIWLPLSSRLGRLADLAAEQKTIVMEGVLAIQAGTPSRALGERLRAMVPADPKAAKNDAKKGDLKAAKGAAVPEPQKKAA